MSSPSMWRRPGVRAWLGAALVGAVVGLGAAVHGILVDPFVPDDRDRAPPGEDAIIGELEALAVRQIIDAAKPDGLTKRDAHPAPHGCVQAYFRVRDDIPEALRHGVLAQPGREFPAWIRLSNGLFFDDNAADARGFAIKLMDVPGEKLLPAQRDAETQDFVMINNANFPIANVPEYLSFFRAQITGNSFGYFLGFDPWQWHLREMRVGLGMLKRPANPLSTTYHTMLPFRLGPHDAKFSVLPCDPAHTDACVEWQQDVPSQRSDHYLREAMIRTLTPRAAESDGQNAAAARFAFRVQLRVPGASMPIEDATIAWSTYRSPYVQVADIRIPAQRFSSEAQNVFCENLSFTPWHALPAHEPLGGLNRARKRVYDEISRVRHARNGVLRHEPRGHCLQLDGEACPVLARSEAPR